MGCVGDGVGLGVGDGVGLGVGDGVGGGVGLGVGLADGKFVGLLGGGLGVGLFVASGVESHTRTSSFHELSSTRTNIFPKSQWLHHGSSGVEAHFCQNAARF
jgi:hypothetical protein